MSQPPRIVSFSDATTGILIEATQNPYTGDLVDQFPNRALIESYGKQILLQQSPATSAAISPAAISPATVSPATVSPATVSTARTSGVTTVALAG